MKNYTSFVSVLAVAVTLLFAFTSQQQQRAELGTIRYSILPPKEFADQNGLGWIFLDGSIIDGTNINIAKSKLNTTYPSIKQIPDGRGVFVRIFNNGRDAASGDPEGDRVIGSYQNDQITTHSHDVHFLNRSGDIAGFHNLSGQGVNEQRLTWGDRAPYNNAASGLHITATGGPESRPRNIVVYAYIKVN